MPDKLETPTKTTQVPTSEVLNTTIKETSMPSPDPTRTPSGTGVLTESSQASAQNEDWAIPCSSQDTSYRRVVAHRRYDLDRSFTMSRDSPLNSAQEPSQEVPQDKCGTVQSKKPQMPDKLETPTKTTQVPTSEVLNTTIKETSMPSPDPTRTPSGTGVRTQSSQAPAQNEDWAIPCSSQDTSYRRVVAHRRYDLDRSFTMSRDSPLNSAQDPSKKSQLDSARARNYRSVTPDVTNLPVEEILSPRTQEQVRTSIRALFPNGPPITPIRPLMRSKKSEERQTAKCARRGPTSANKTSTGFNSRTQQIAKRLKSDESICNALGGPPEEQPAFSHPTSTPSTSADNDSTNSNYNFHIDIVDDDDLPEIFWSNNSKGSNECSTSKNIADDVDIITMDEDYRDFEIDLIMPEELILAVSENHTEVDKVSENSLPAPPPNPTALRPIIPTTSSDVIIIDDVSDNSNMLNSSSTRASSNLSTRPGLQTNNSSETIQSYKVVEVPDGWEPINMSCRASVSSSADCDDDVQFISEFRLSESNLSPEKRIALHEVVTSLTKSIKRQLRNPGNSKRAKVNDNLDTGYNNENAAPLVNNEIEALANEDTITVNQVQTSGSNILSPQSGGCSSSGRQLGKCPICFDNMSFITGSIASTNCGHVFCLECIKKSLKANEKKCPTCRKQLKGRGYHQVFL